MRYNDPTLIIYWAHTRVPLTYAERQNLEADLALIVSVTPSEILIETEAHGLVAIRGVTDPLAPAVPAPREGNEAG